MLSTELSEECQKRIWGITDEIIFGKKANGKFKTVNFEQTMKRIHKFLAGFKLFNSEFVMVSKNIDVAAQINNDFRGRF